jgi:hypothetical protein
MSSKIGLIVEGPIDGALLPALLSCIAANLAGIHWPVQADDVAEMFPVRKRGHGGVLDTVRRLVDALDTQYFEHKFFIILLDRRTKTVQKEVRRLIAPHPRFVLGIAIEEIEAWWLGDRTNTLAWVGLDEVPRGLRYADEDYHAESDSDPKETLDKLTHASDRFDRGYGVGNLDHAREFAENYWRVGARLDEIRAQCAQGFAPFENDVIQRFRKLSPARRRST